tara:strand:+ start:492 stop:1529 length:1038 start_codon:yes stop_codon:yes gene_type:complete
MAINTAAHSPKEFQILVAPEATVGTAPAGSAFKAIEADSISMPTYNDLRVIEQRAGSVGRVVNTGDLLSHEEGAVHEFSVAGVMTEELWPILIPAALGVAASSDACTLASNFEATSYVYGATSSGAHQSVSFHVNGLANADTSATGNSYAIPGCVVTSLKITANAQENGGRLMFELTAQTRNTLTAAGAAKLSGFSDFSTNFMYLADYTEDKKIGGQVVSLESLDLTIENPVAFLGNKTVSGFEGTPESLIRMIPGLDVTCAAVVKYDDNVDQFFQLQKELTAITSDACTLADNSTFGSASIGGISIPAGVITECAFDEGDYLKLAFTVKMIDNGSGNMISVRVA